MSHQDSLCASLWGEVSQAMPELFRLTGEPQTSVSQLAAAASTPAFSMPPCCFYACQTFHGSDPEEFLHTFLGGEWIKRATLFPLLLPSNEVSAIPKQQTYRVTDLSHGSTSSVIWSGMFTLFPTHLGVWLCKIWIPALCANMWQETSQTDVSVLKRVLKKNPHH